MPTTAPSPRVRRRERGAATVEFALVAPLLITILMFSVFITDLVRVKLKLQEASRYVAFEMTSYVLTDFGSGNHDAAFNEAMDKTVAEAQARYHDLDSVEDNAGSGQVFDYQPLQASVVNQSVPLVNRPFNVGGGGGVFAGLITRLNSGLNGALGLWGFNPKGRVQATVRMQVTNKFLARDFYNTGDGLFTVDQYGGAQLDSFDMSDRYTLTASGWHLPDGADQTVNRSSGMAGDHNVDRDSKAGGLYTQVDRMTYAGLKNGAQGLIPGLRSIEQFLPIPQFWGTYVVSHNYMEPARSERNRGNGQNNCNVTGRSNGFNGLHNLAADTSPSTGQHPPLLKTGSTSDIQMRCFDTAPFRDTVSLNNSLYAKIYGARGEYFMGCQNAMADDPTLSRTYANDEEKAAAKEVCSAVAP